MQAHRPCCCSDDVLQGPHGPNNRKERTTDELETYLRELGVAPSVAFFTAATAPRGYTAAKALRDLETLKANPVARNPIGVLTWLIQRGQVPICHRSGNGGALRSMSGGGSTVSGKTVEARFEEPITRTSATHSSIIR
jgi:hypothetical protein